jgi:cation:H+ antiporter
VLTLTGVSSPVLVLEVIVFAIASLTASSLLIVRIERLGTRFGLTEALLGFVAALAADAPELVTAITALVRGQHTVGITVILGANVFQLATLLGLGALISGGIRLDRRVVAFEGLAAGWIALVTVPVVSGRMSAVLGLVLALVVFVPYLVISSLSPERRAKLPLPRQFRTDVTDAIDEEEDAIAEVVGHQESKRSDLPIAVIMLAIVIAASVLLEQSASTLGTRWSIPDVVLGGVILAGITSLPNLVAAIYLARRGRGEATLSEALNSNRINTLVGLLIPAAVVAGGVGVAVASGTKVLAYAYLLMTIFVVTVAYLRRGVSRVVGSVLLLAYLAVIALLVTIA